MTKTMFTPKIVTVLREGYGVQTLKADILAGLTVAIVALPLAMALAIASGASPDKGLVTAVIAGFLISLLGGSRVQIGGPTGAFVVVVYGVIAQHGYDGLLLATLMAGVILVAAGYARLGQVIKFIPHPVVTGFTAGIAVIIATSQVKDFLGLRAENLPAEFLPKWAAYFAHIDTVQMGALAIGAGALAVIVGLRRYAPKMPGYLIAVVLSAAAVAAFGIPVETIGSRFPDIPAGLPVPEIPAWSFAKMHEVLPAALTIAFLAGIEALLSAMVADGMTGFKHRPNQELVGQGVANIASAFFMGLPATGAIARTATNIKSGGKTPMAGMFHAVFVLLFMMFGMDLVAYVPMAALAAILFVVAWGMSEARHFIHIFKMSASDRTVLLLTFLLTVLVDLTVAIAVGVILACLIFMKQMTRAARFGEDADDEGGEDVVQRDGLPEGVDVFRISGPVFFGVAGDLMEALRAIARTPKVLILRMRLVPYLDASGETVIENIIRDCRAGGTHVILCGVQAQPRGILKNGGVGDGADGVSFAVDYAAALAEAAHRVAATGNG